MKTTLLSFAILLSSFFAVKANQSVEFIVTKSDTILCYNVKECATYLNATNINGTTVKIDKNEVALYMADGKVYETHAIYQNGKPTNQYSINQVIAYRNGLKLCKYSYTENGSKKEALAVYKNNQFYVDLNAKNADGILNFFRITNVNL
jgi:hypothetical protein